MAFPQRGNSGEGHIASEAKDNPTGHVACDTQGQERDLSHLEPSCQSSGLAFLFLHIQDMPFLMATFSGCNVLSCAR